MNLLEVCFWQWLGERILTGRGETLDAIMHLFSKQFAKYMEAGWREPDAAFIARESVRGWMENAQMHSYDSEFADYIEHLMGGDSVRDIAADSSPIDHGEP